MTWYTLITRKSCLTIREYEHGSYNCCIIKLFLDILKHLKR